MKFNQREVIPVAREPLWNFLMDIPKVAQSLPGVEKVDRIDDSTYQGTLKVRVGPISLNLQGKIILEQRDHENYRATMRAEASDRMVSGAVRGKTFMELKELSATETELLVETRREHPGKDRRVWTAHHSQEIRRDAQGVRRKHQKAVSGELGQKSKTSFRLLSEFSPAFTSLESSTYPVVDPAKPRTGNVKKLATARCSALLCLNISVRMIGNSKVQRKAASHSE
jgi:carbon monoxide dehydrogenase subunit G